MDWSSIKFDTTINTESLVASIGVLGAAVGYLLNMIRTWRQEAKEKKYSGTNAFILDMLESSFVSGLSEDELWEIYNDSSTSAKRKTFGAWHPKKLTRFGFEKQLRHLQGRFLIRLTGHNHYHIDFTEQNRWHSEAKRQSVIQLRESLIKDVGPENLHKILSEHLAESNVDSYRRRDILTALFHLDHKNVSSILSSDLQSNDEAKIEAAVSIINRLYDSRL